MDSVVDNSLSSVGANLKLSDDVSSEKDIDATKAQSPKSQNRMQANKSINVSVLWEHKSFGGTQGVYEHTSVLCNCTMRFSLYLPPQAKEGPVPVVIWLGGQGNGCDYMITHCGPQELCAKYGVALAAPDVSPSIGQGIPDSPMERDFGIGAGFFIDATEEPWAGHYQMFSYVSEEFPKFIARHFNVDSKKQGLFGHDMGGHGALVIGLRNPEKFKSLSAFAPYCSLSQSPVGKKALEGYLGTVNSENTWRNYDAVNLIEDGHLFPGEILVEQGTDDRYLSSQLKPELFEDACKRQGQEYTINFREGYDHSSFFIRSFFDLHLEHHVRALSLKKELDEIGLIKNIGDTGDQFN
ncbi:S-formylglutathione hydrolase [Rhodospirillales bacterium]|nr:S-formylglutathione hydrolase [Rhodospirillales bacterium]